MNTECIKKILEKVYINTILSVHKSFKNKRISHELYLKFT